jgi:type I restriction enzyme S subunit
MSKWKETTFSEFVDINPQVKLIKSEEYSYVEMKDLDGRNKFCFPSTQRKYLGGSKFENGDTLFARITPCLENGKICQVKGLDKFKGFGSTEFYVFRGKQYVSDNEFVYYLSRWDETRAFAEMSFDGTSGRQRVPKSAFDSLIISVPPLPEQIAISSILSSLDDKIDLLHRNNKTLETLAETIFRQWFIEEAHEDWEEKSLIDVIDLVGGGTPKTSMEQYWNGDINWLSAGDITSNHKSFVLSTEKQITQEGLDNSSAKLMPQYSMVISARGTVGKYSILAEPMTFSQSNYGILPKSSKNYFFTYLLINSFIDNLKAAAYGSVFDTITTRTFKESVMPMPNSNEIEGFETKIKPLFIKMLKNSCQIKTLESLRDTLLPKLISGEIRIKM